MSGDAIHTDVSGQETGTSDQEEQLSERDLALQEIHDEVHGGAGSSIAKEDEIDSQIDAADALPEVLAGERLGKTKVVVKIDGEDVELPVSEVIRGYQKDSTASRRLEEAARERQRLEELKATLENGRDGSDDKNSLSTDEVDVDEQVSAVMSALVEGDEASAAEALKRILAQGRGGKAATSVDHDALAEQIETRLEQKNQQRQQQDAQARDWESFVGNNPMFADNDSPERVYGDHLFASRYAAQIEDGSLSYREALNKTAADVAKRFGVTVPTKDTRSDKVDRKRQLDTLSVAGARAVKGQEHTETTEDVLAEMARSRGLPV